MTASRAISLNPRNTDTVATMAMMIAFSGEWDRGVEFTREAMALNPHHPGCHRTLAVLVIATAKVTKFGQTNPLGVPAVS